MVIKVGINGFGRVGRVVFRTCLSHPDVEVSAINDPAVEVEYICYLIKFDSTHGTLKGKVTCTEDEIIIDDLSVKVFRQKLPNSIPWQSAGVEYVVEASGMFTNLEKASGHLECEGVKRVIVTAPSVDIPMAVIGVNHNKIKSEHKVISCGSSTLYCLAPIVKVLEDNYGVEDGFITSIHAMTPSLKPLDGLCLKGKHWRDHRSITQNIIPAVTGACKALGRVLPAVRDRMCGLAFRVPIVNVSVLDLTVRLKKYTSIDNIVSDIERFKKTLKETIITTSNEEAVSSDFIGNSHSCILDVSSSLQLKPNAFKLICWYENEYSYACRVVDLILFSEAQFKETETCLVYVAASDSKVNKTQDFKVNSSNKMTYVRPKTSRRYDTVLQTGGDKKPIVLDTSSAVKNESIKDLPVKPQLVLPSTLRSLDSEFLGKTLIPRSLVVQTPIPSLPRDTNKRIELFKIWNTDNVDKTNVRPNMSSFFQVYSKPSKNECDQAQECLERVKKEFSKIVGITEGLLDKNTNNRLKLSTIKAMNQEIAIPLSNEIKPTIGNRSNDIKYLGINTIGNGNTSITVTDKNVLGDFKQDIAGSTLCKKDTSSSDDSAYRSNTMSDIKSSLTSEPDKNFIELKEINEKRHLDDKGFISKTLTNIMDGFSKNIQSLALTNKMVLSPTINDKVIIKEYESKSEGKSDEHGSNNLETESGEKQIAEISTDTVANNHSFAIDNTYKTISLKNEVDILEYPNHHKDKQNNMDKIEHSDSVNVTRSNINYAMIRVNSYTSVAESYAFAADDVSCSESHYKNKQDIYDKLDSDSASDSGSDNFNIDGRKSQVLKISDLTNSLDDLDRLDKICKIMEISDELSDKLFSALDGTSSVDNVTGQKWSFKDLCEKINLDEFCNKVFGK